MRWLLACQCRVDLTLQNVTQPNYHAGNHERCKSML